MKLGNKYFLLSFIFLLYILLVLFGVNYHEPWRDEAHAWVVAQDDSIGQMIESVHAAPTPLLWYLLLVPFAKSGFPYSTMNVFHAGLAVVAMGLILFFGRMPLALKILFVFSYYAAYEYAVVARNYVLTMVIVFAIAAMYTKRFTRPILFAFLVFGLFQTNIYSFVPALALACLFSLELFKKHMTAKEIIAVAVVAIGALFTIVIFLPDPRYPNQDPPLSAIVEFGVILRNFLVPSLPNISWDIARSGQFDAAVLMLTAISFICLLVMLWKQKSILILAVATFAWFFYLNMFRHGGTLRQHGLFLIYFIFFWWLMLTKRYALERHEKLATWILHVCLGVLFLVSVGFTAYIYAEEYQNNFSGAQDMAKFVMAHHLDQGKIVLYVLHDAEAILPYFPNKTFWYPELGGYARYHINDQRRWNLPPLGVEDIVEMVKKSFPGDTSVLLLLSTPIPATETDYVLLHASLTNPKYFWSNATENFWLYARRERVLYDGLL